MLNDRSDTTQLLGCFEQTSQDLTQLQSEIAKSYIDRLTGPVISLQHKLAATRDLEDQILIIEEFIS